MRAEAGGDGELEGGAGVVVEAADETRVDVVRDLAGVEGAKDFGEVGAGVFAQVIGDFGEGVDDVLVGFVLGIQNAQRIRFSTALVVGAEQVRDRNEGFAEGNVIAGAIFGVSDGVEVELPVADA